MTQKGQGDDPVWDAQIKGYNRPGAPPREEMWEVIAGSLPLAESSNPKVVSFPGRRRWIAPSIAAAAVLVVGIGVGRLTVLSPELPNPALAGGSDAESVTSTGRFGTVRMPPFRTLAADYLLDTEAFLTLLRADARQGQLNSDMGQWARALLVQTRLLLDTGQVPGPSVQALLEDLELILDAVPEDTFLRQAIVENGIRCATNHRVSAEGMLKAAKARSHAERTGNTAGISIASAKEHCVEQA